MRHLGPFKARCAVPSTGTTPGGVNGFPARNGCENIPICETIAPFALTVQAYEQTEGERPTW